MPGLCSFDAPVALFLVLYWYRLGSDIDHDSIVGAFWRLLELIGALKRDCQKVRYEKGRYVQCKCHARSVLQSLESPNADAKQCCTRTA